VARAEGEHAPAAGEHAPDLTAAADDLTAAVERHDSVWQACVPDGWDATSPPHRRPTRRPRPNTPAAPLRPSCRMSP
jgi:hypothetical protein